MIATIAAVLQRLVRHRAGNARLPLPGRHPLRTPMPYPAVHAALVAACRVEGVGDAAALAAFGAPFLPRVVTATTPRQRQRKGGRTYERPNQTWELFKRLVCVVDERGALYFEDVVGATVDRVVRYLKAAIKHHGSKMTAAARITAELRTLYSALGRWDIAEALLGRAAPLWVAVHSPIRQLEQLGLLRAGRRA